MALSNLSYRSWQASNYEANEAIIAYRGYVHPHINNEMPSTCALVCACVGNVLIAIGMTFAAIPEFLSLSCNHSTSFWTQARIYGALSLLCLAAIFNSEQSFEELRAFEVRSCLEDLFGWEGVDVPCDIGFFDSPQIKFDRFVEGFPLLNESQQQEIVRDIARNLTINKVYDPVILRQFQECIISIESNNNVNSTCKEQLANIRDLCSKLPVLHSPNIEPPVAPPRPTVVATPPVLPPALPPAPAPAAQAKNTKVNVELLCNNLDSTEARINMMAIIDFVFATKDTAKKGPNYVKLLTFCIREKQWLTLKTILHTMLTGRNRIEFQKYLIASPASAAVRDFETAWKTFPYAEQFEVAQLMYQARLMINDKDSFLPCLDDIPRKILELAKNASPIPKDYQQFLTPLMPITEVITDDLFDWLWFAKTTQNQRHVNDAIMRILSGKGLGQKTLLEVITVEQATLFIECFKTYQGPFKSSKDDLKAQALALKRFAELHAEKHPDWAKLCTDHLNAHKVYEEFLSASAVTL